MKKQVTVKHLLTRFYTQVDTISELNFNDKLQVLFALRKASLEEHDKHILIGAAGGKYDVHRVSAVFQNIYRKQIPPNETHATSRIGLDTRAAPKSRISVHTNGRERIRISA